VFQNLIDNAIKYANKEDKKIKVEYLFDKSKHAHQFAVIDNGPGIPELFQKRVFDIFVSYNEDPNIDSGGIGLSIVHKIVTDNRGDIWVESDGKTGSAFKFTIPT
jgi:signal transduction histidine kinase